MSNSCQEKIRVNANELTVGMYVDLELGWYDHPFAFTKFKIKSEKDLKVIRSLKVKQVTIIPEKSDVTIAIFESNPETLQSEAEPEPEFDPEKNAELDKLWQQKLAQQERSRVLREKRKKVTREYQQHTSQIRQVTNDMKTRPANAIHNMDGIVNEMVSIFDGGEDMAANLVNLSSGPNDDYNHITNVAMLSLMLGSATDISGTKLKLLGTGALLHDIGKIDLPGNIKIKKTALTLTEEKIMQRHAINGRQLVERIRGMNGEVLDIIDKHHELLDGSGYPHGLDGDKLSTLVRIVAIVNLYDNLCNPVTPENAMTPKNALATLYKHYQNKLDIDLVKRLIKLLGVYPPGTVVQLNDGGIGLVISANPQSSLRPGVLIYDPDIPKEEAMIIDLSEHADIHILEALSPGSFPPEIHRYLGIQERIGYMMEKDVSFK